MSGKLGGLRQGPKLFGSYGIIWLHKGVITQHEGKRKSHIVDHVHAESSSEFIVSAGPAQVIGVQRSSSRDQKSALEHYIPGRVNCCQKP